MVKGRSTELEQSLAQLEEYQSQMQQLRQKIVQEEQHLRVVLAPTYSPHDREAAISEQQVSVFVFLRVVFLDYFRHFRFNISFFFGRLQFHAELKMKNRNKQIPMFIIINLKYVLLLFLANSLHFNDSIS